MKINTKIKEKLTSLYQADSGMTLIEILIACAIIVILMAVTMISLPRYRDSRLLEQASKDVNDTLRQAQTLALSPNMPNAQYYIWDIKLGEDDDTQCPDRQYIGIVADVEGAVEKKMCLDDKINLQPVDASPLYFEVKTGKIYSDETLATSANGKLTMEHVNHPGDGGLYYEINVKANTFSLGKEVVENDGQSGLTLACGNNICEADKGEKCGTCGDCACVCPTDGLQYCNQQSCPSANWYDGSCHELPKPSAICGDGEKQSGEACDDGNVLDGDHCSSDCQMITGMCGDGLTNGGEGCDDGENNNHYGYCNANCSAKLKCGDSIIQTQFGEVCDDGNTVNGDSCSSDCKTNTTCNDNIQYCSTRELCVAKGYFWHVDKCEATPKCSDGQQYCKCSDGAQYCKCSDGAQYCKCSDGAQYCKCPGDGIQYCNKDATNCRNNGGWWYNNTCITKPTTSTECTSKGGYWYSNTCNTTSPFANITPISTQNRLMSIYNSISTPTDQASFISKINTARSVMSENYFANALVPDLELYSRYSTSIMFIIMDNYISICSRYPIHCNR